MPFTNAAFSFAISLTARTTRHASVTLNSQSFCRWHCHLPHSYKTPHVRQYSTLRLPSSSFVDPFYSRQFCQHRNFHFRRRKPQSATTTPTPRIHPRFSQPTSDLQQQAQQEQFKENIKYATPTTKPTPTPALKRDRLLIVGLGNPGTQFHQTRHNIGFHLLDAFANRHHTAFTHHSKFQGDFTILNNFENQKVFLLKPMTFINNSGNPLRNVMSYYKVDKRNVIVIVDDMALEVGRIRLRLEGSSGGHNGLKSIEKVLGDRKYCRLRVGVGECRGGSEKWKGHVLGRFGKREKEVIEEEVVWDVAEVLESWIRENEFKTVMNTVSRLQNRQN